jgi:hypothetical protein
MANSIGESISFLCGRLLGHHRHASACGITKQVENNLIRGASVAILIHEPARNDQDFIGHSFLSLHPLTKCGDCLRLLYLCLAKRRHDNVVIPSPRINNYVEGAVVAVDAPRAQLLRQALAKIQVLADKSIIYNHNRIEIGEQLPEVPGQRGIIKLY